MNLTSFDGVWTSQVNDVVNSEWIAEDFIQKWQQSAIQPQKSNDLTPHTRVCFYCYADIWNR
jgi:hypothetical protein